MRFWIAMIVAISLFSACKKSDDPKTAAYWLDRIGSKNERLDAIKELGKIGDKAAVPALIEWMNKEGDWQAEAAYALGQLNDPSVVPELVKALDFTVGPGNDKKTRSRNRMNANILRALGMLKAKDAVEPIMKLTSASEPTVREASLRALGQINNPAATSHLVEIALNDREPYLRKVAIEALGDMGDPKAIPALVKALFVEVPGISFYNEARLSLVQMGLKCVPELLKTMKHENKDVEGITYSDGRGLGDGTVEGKSSSVLGYLKAKEGEPMMIEALNKLWKQFKARDESKPLFASVPGAVIEITYSLGNLGTPAAAKAVLPLAIDPERAIRVPATEALTQIGDRSVVKPLLDAMKKGEPEGRRALLIAISRLGEGSDLDAFDKLVKLADKDVPKEAMSQMIQEERVRLVAAQDCKKDITCWRNKLDDQDARVRDKAAWELGWVGTKDVLDDLLKVVKDQDPTVRMAGVLSMRRINNADTTKLWSLYESWGKKLDFAGANLELRRYIAYLESQNRK
jgi:HEAT repeat protein